MTASIKGLAGWQGRLGEAASSEAMKTALRREAEAIAEEARASAPAAFSATIQIADESRGMKLAFRIGTSEPLGRVLEFGTLQKPAASWLLPAFRSRLGRIKDILRKAATTTERGRF